MDFQGKITQKGAYTGNITVGGAYNLYPRGPGGLPRHFNLVKPLYCDFAVGL